VNTFREKGIEAPLRSPLSILQKLDLKPKKFHLVLPKDQIEIEHKNLVQNELQLQRQLGK